MAPTTPLFENGAVYLAAVLEYITAEVLELSGKVAKVDGAIYITPRHVFLGIRNDKELDEMFRHCVIRQSGVKPLVHSVLVPDHKSPLKDTTPFEDMMIAKVSEASQRTLLAPHSLTTHSSLTPYSLLTPHPSPVRSLLPAHTPSWTPAQGCTAWWWAGS